MQRLRASELGSSDGAVEGRCERVRAEGLDGKGPQTDSAVNMSHEVTVESRPGENQEEKSGHRKAEKETSELEEPLAKSNSSLKQGEEQKKDEKKESTEGTHEKDVVADQEKASVEVSQKSAPTESMKTSSRENSVEKKSSSFPETPKPRKMAANLSMDHGSCSDAKTEMVSTGKEQSVKKEKKTEAVPDVQPSSWCQTQLPEAVAERPVEVGAVGEVKPKSKDVKKAKTDKGSQSVKNIQCSYEGFGSTSLGRDKKAFMQDVQEIHGASRYGNPYCPAYSVSGGAVYGGLEPGGGASADWQMDSVIEQIEKQMAAVLEKIEGDMPSLLEQISDHPETLPRAKSASSSPSPRPRTQHHSTPPPLPTTPRPTMPSLPHLTIPPPAYPPPSPPSQVQGHSHPTADEDNSDGQRDTMRSGQSPKGSV